MRKPRVGKNMLLNGAEWVEFDTYPSGMKLALEVRSVRGITKGEKGEAILLVDNGQGRTPVHLLDLYEPALRKVLLLRSGYGLYMEPIEEALPDKENHEQSVPA